MQSRLHAHIGTMRQLEILLAVHDKGSINEAAKMLFYRHHRKPFRPGNEILLFRTDPEDGEFR